MPLADYLPQTTFTLLSKALHRLMLIIVASSCTTLAIADNTANAVSKDKDTITLRLLPGKNRVAINDDIDVSKKSISAIYHALDLVSHNSYRIPLGISDIEANPLLGAFVQLRRDDKNFSQSHSNAAIIGQSRCHLLLSTAGHSLLDTEYNNLTTPQQVEVQLKPGEWTKALQLYAPKALSSQSDEWQDWGLVIVRKPICAPYPSLVTKPVSKAELQACQGRVQLACFHPDRPLFKDQIQLEQGCSVLMSNQPKRAAAGLQTRNTQQHKDNWVAYFSCKQSKGASGCAPVCELGGELRNLGVFSKSIQGSQETVVPQRVGAFRVVSGDYYQAIQVLAKQYSIQLGN